MEHAIERRSFWAFGLTLALVVVLAISPKVGLGAVDGSIPIGAPARLFQETHADFPGPPATWRLDPTSENEHDNISWRLTLQLGPQTVGRDDLLVLFWQIGESTVADDEGDTVIRLLGPPESLALRPFCDSGGACAGAFDLAADLTALGAGSGGERSIAIHFTAVRSWDDGSQIQTIVPTQSAEKGGTVAHPLPVSGDTFASIPYPLSDGAPAEIDGQDAAFDYVTEVEALLRTATPAVPSPVPPTIVSWPAATNSTSPTPFQHGNDSSAKPTVPVPPEPSVEPSPRPATGGTLEGNWNSILLIFALVALVAASAIIAVRARR